MFQRKQLSKEQALQKLRHFCSYQERCHQEVKEKLYSFQLRKDVVEESIAQLIEEDYLNEERFAIQFAGGKFRIKQWGRIRIMHALKEKRIAQYCITRALKEIDEEAYMQTLEKLAQKKWDLLENENEMMRKNKTKMYLIQKGFEQDKVNAAVKNIILAKT